MKGNIKIHKSVKYVAAIFSVLSILIIQSCIDAITTVEEPESARAGEMITLKFKVNITSNALGDIDPTNLYVGFLVPRSWNATRGNNTTISYTSSIGNGRFVLLDNSVKVPNSAFPDLSYPEYLKTIYRAGNNFIDDHEWIVYKSDKQYVLKSGQSIQPTITIQTKVGPQALSTKFAYFATYNGAGAGQGGDDSKVYLSTSCFDVIGGTGDFIDFCTKPLANASPLAASDKDLLTFDFDNDLLPTKLTGINDVYLCLEATTTDNRVITKCGGDDASKLKLIANDEYRLVIYPRTYFALTKNENLKQIRYLVINKDGSKRAGKRGGEEPFVYKFTPCN
ncbi:DUF4961 domain-containing protein [Mucilaginibacter limnophilus]|uniref:DUF4961 domain-containing protein n=1 Tax=Mucilaginibacter limnophilus TaxID=1932778 RepID=A0A437MTJ5_9SPHI|nr:DUF4961 domain-containing protein [Mucilaginibacter limnophilus]RVU00984.1 DUF4961 domain-containing protein [Mucilaginibacter limnophilus]